MKLLILASLLLAGCGAVSKSDLSGAVFKDPVGDRARYKVDKDPYRTMRAVKSGIFDVKVLDRTRTDASVEITYNLQIAVLGNRTGVKVITVPAEYWEPSWWERLHKSGRIETEQYKVEHLGYGDAENMDGSIYRNCDIVRFYDLNDPQLGDVQNVELEMMTLVGTLDAIGAAKIDVSGDMSGTEFYVGSDYTPPK